MQTPSWRRFGILMSTLLMTALLFSACAPAAAPAAPAAPAPAAAGGEWSLEQAAAPYAGTTINCVFLDRPGYRAAIELIPEFEA
ncbi:MAG: sugar ABC transporter substrate-binding protein, partial [Caldilinea sp.]